MVKKGTEERERERRGKGRRKRRTRMREGERWSKTAKRGEKGRRRP